MASLRTKQRDLAPLTPPPPPNPPTKKKKKEEKEKDIMEAYIIKENVRYSNSVIHDFLYNGNYQFLDPNPSRQE